MATGVSLTAKAPLRISSHLIPAHGRFPNTSLSSPPLPLTIYHACFPRRTSPSTIESYIRSIGICEPAWRYTMYRQHHYHSTTHEMLCVITGSAIVCFGGAEKSAFDEAVEVEIRAGDVVLIPAGVGHALLRETSREAEAFQMIGSYPVGCERGDICTTEDEEEAVGRAWGKVTALGGWKGDPIYGGLL